MAQRLHNFSAGPAALPLSVINQIKEDLPVYANTGASVMEISHRGKAFIEIYEGAQDRLRRLLGLSSDWHVLFLQGGATMQFHQVALNFLPRSGSADYIITGTWSKKALKEAQVIGPVRVAATSEATQFDRIPDPTTWDLDPEAAYVHLTSNNTIAGTQLRQDLHLSRPIIADMSSDFCSRPIDLEPYGLIYAGAQKNMGPSGVTIVLVHDRMLAQQQAGLPPILDYRSHIDTMFNTPPTFPVYVVGLVLSWLESQGGLASIQQRNAEKANRVYAAIDAHDVYVGATAAADRSQMNVTFRLASPDLEDRFLEGAAARGLVGLKGHRSVGGIRASIYNACDDAAIGALVDFMEAFASESA